MNLFIDKNHRRKSPIAIAGFFATLLDLCIYGVLYTLLAEPLYRQLTLPSTAATNAVHTLIIALAGTAIGQPAVPSAGQAGGAVRVCGAGGGSGDVLLRSLDAGYRPAGQHGAADYPVWCGTGPDRKRGGLAGLSQAEKDPSSACAEDSAGEMREAAGTKADAAPKAHPAAPAAEERPRRSPQEDAMLLFEDGEDAGCHRRRNTHGKDEDS